MKRGDYKVSDLTATDSLALQSSLASTYNAATQSEYTIEQRLNALININTLLDNAYKGAIYKWDKFRSNKANIPLPNGKYRKTKISADYLITIPSDKKGETIYCFAFQTNKSAKKEPIKLNIHSIFADCVDLTKGQERPFTILQETKINAKTKISEQLYVHPAYANELEQLQNAEQTTEISAPSVSKPKVTNIMQADSTTQVPFELGAGGVASISPNAPLPSFNDFIKAVKDMANTVNLAVVKFEHKVSETINKLLNPPKSKPKSVSKARTAKSDKSTAPKKKTVKTSQSVSERKPVKQVAQDKSKAREKRKSVLSELDSISSAQKKNEQQRSHQHTKSKSNNIDI